MTPPPDLHYAAPAMKREQALEHVTSVVRASGTSFYWAMRMLPRRKRDAMYAVYAFCREVDDIADDPGMQSEKLNRLGAWRVEIERLFNGHPQDPVSLALAGPVAEFSLPKPVFLAVIEGMEIDAADSVRMPTLSALEAYCDRVACAVGRLSNRVFGIDDDRGESVAVALGQALQLTNILRDLAEDAAIDRLYVPNDMLAVYDIPPNSAIRAIRHPRFTEVCNELAGLARRRYSEAETALAACDRRTMRPAIMMMQNYSRILDQLVERGWESPEKPVSLGKLQKLWILVSYGLI